MKLHRHWWGRQLSRSLHREATFSADKKLVLILGAGVLQQQAGRLGELQTKT